jgi:hypothetical protein
MHSRPAPSNLGAELKLLAAAVIMLIPSAAAATLAFDSSRITVEAEGLDSSLVALLVESPPTGPPPFFQVSAEEITIFREWSDPAFVVAGNDLNLAEGITYGTERNPWGTASLELASLEWAARVNVFALPGSPSPRLRLEGCSELTRPAIEQVTRQPNVYAPRPDFRVDLAQALQIEVCDDEPVRLTGDFAITFWYATLTARNEERTESIETGNHPSQRVADPTGTAQERIEAYVEVRNGQLAFEVPSWAQLYAAQPALVGAARVEAHVASGQLALEHAGIPLDERQVALQGDFEGTFSPQSDRVHLDAQVDLGTAMIDGQSIALKPSKPAPIAAIAGIALGLPVAAMAAYLLLTSRALRRSPPPGELLTTPTTTRQRHGMAWFLVARQLIEQRRPRRARIANALARWHFPHSLDIQLASAVVWLDRKHLKKARAALEECYNNISDQRTAGQLASMLAETAARMQRPRDAERWLAECARRNPDLFAQEIQRPIFRAFTARTAPRSGDPAFG